MRISIIDYHPTIAIYLKKGSIIWVEISVQQQSLYNISLYAQTILLLTSKGMPAANLNPAFASACRRASNGYNTKKYMYDVRVERI